MTTPCGTAEITEITEITEIIFPEHANHYGTLFGGQALQLMSKAAFLAARGATQRDVVMAGVTDVRFLAPVPVGHVLTLRAWVSRVGRCSLTVCVTGLAQTLGSPQEDVLKGVFDMVAVDARGRPAAIAQAYMNQEPA
ncbi:MAG: acyl-CoA thioesterase [Comamonadaceae bacterium]|nr:MAG: acyl-CoA thioesterase [Comamonadaceae bacterium]